MAWPLLYVAGVNVVRSTWQSRVHGVVEQLAEGLAAGQHERIRRRIRDLADDLMRDMLHAICGASASELAEAMTAFEESRPERAALQRAVARMSTVERFSKTDSAHPRHTTQLTQAHPEESGRRERERASRLPRPPSQTHDPFDITMPSELLASTEETKQNRSDGSGSTAATRHASGRETRLPRLLSTLATSPASADDAEAESERRPKVVLREGERLLKGTGSGVVIRRERRVKP
ncbi:MAG: hypothetical protein M3O50_19040 [Myxococcota bacterium]|nr:hypothetical protein [Myxococcota bacterium]